MKNRVGTSGWEKEDTAGNNNQMEGHVSLQTVLCKLREKCLNLEFPSETGKAFIAILNVLRCLLESPWKVMRPSWPLME